MGVEVKICGLSTAETVETAIAAGADYVGLVLYPRSPRGVDLATARALAAVARGKAQIVVLMVDPDDDVLARALGEIAPDMLQLHGSEAPERVRAIRARHGKRVMKAIKVATAADAGAAFDYRGIADLILFDAKPPQDADRPGGHGRPFDWHVLDAVRDQVAFMLSGGLDADNVADAIRATRAGAVDVSSGVETRPGVKDPALIRRFIAAAKSAN